MAFSQWTSLFSVSSQPTLAMDSWTWSETTQGRLELVKQATTTRGFNWDLMGGQQQGFNLNHLPALPPLSQCFLCAVLAVGQHMRWWQVKN